MIRKRSSPSDKSRKPSAPVAADQPIREVNGVSIAAQQLRSFIDRILNLKAEQDVIGDDVKDIYAEAKSFGFDRTAIGALVTELRRKAKDPAKFEEADTILDLYRNAYEEAGAASRTHTDARAREDKPKLAVVAGKDKRAAVEIQESAADLNRRGSTSTENVSNAISELNAREALVSDEPSPEAGPQAEASQSQGTGAGTLADREGRHEGEAASVDLPTIPPVGAADDHSVIAGAGAAVASAAPAEIPDADIPAFLKVGHRHPAMQTPASPRAEAIALRRPFCQHLNNWAKCAGHGDVHCSSCQKIADEARQ